MPTWRGSEPVAGTSYAGLRAPPLWVFDRPWAPLDAAGSHVRVYFERVLQWVNDHVESSLRSLPLCHGRTTNYFRPIVPVAPIEQRLPILLVSHCSTFPRLPPLPEYDDQSEDHDSDYHDYNGYADRKTKHHLPPELNRERT